MGELLNTKMKEYLHKGNRRPLAIPIMANGKRMKNRKDNVKRKKGKG